MVRQHPRKSGRDGAEDTANNRAVALTLRENATSEIAQRARMSEGIPNSRISTRGPCTP